jgi:tRNA(Ile)-lysidine synthase
MCPGRPGPATLAVRHSLAAFLDRAGLHRGDAVVCGVSGGGDSLALAAACVHAGLAVTTVTVDHRLQDGSDRVAARAAHQCRDLGATATVVTVDVAGPGEGPARDARYRALGDAAAGLPVLVAHTADDDAEGLLLALTRGSGTGSLAGLREISRKHPVVDAGASFLGRPLLAATRDQTRGSCAELGLDLWDDPHNEHPEILRSRVRHELLPVMREVLGPRVDAALTRSARLLREDADLLDDLATGALVSAGVAPGDRLPVTVLADRPAPLRRRMLRDWLAGSAGLLTSVHLTRIDALVTDWHGQGPVAVPHPEQAGPTIDIRRNTHRRVVRRRDGALETTHLRRLDTVTSEIPDHPFGDDISGILIDEPTLQQRVRELADEVSDRYRDAPEDLVLVCVLKGAAVFMSDFSRALSVPAQLEFMVVSSYGSGAESSGTVTIVKDLATDIAGRDVVIVEDIIDSGRTLSWLVKDLEGRGPKSLEVVALLRKPDRVVVDVACSALGFEVPDEFIVGYGLDYAERYRTLPWIGALRPEVYS